MSVTTNILRRTFRMRHRDKCGTCFTVDVDNRRYLVTARHLVETIQACWWLSESAAYRLWCAV